jgi:integrase
VKAVLGFIGKEKFACDPCSPSSHNVPARIHYTKKEDGLAQPWPSEGHIWVNPPYGRPMKSWVKKCHDHFVQNPRCEIWLLIPARTGNVYYHELIYKAKTFTFLFKRRLTFWLHGKHEGPIHYTQLSCFSRRYLEYAQRFERDFPFQGTVMGDLTRSPRRANIPLAQESGSVLCMKGGIYTKEKCPICREKFERGENGLLCFRHQTRPKKLFIKLYSREFKKPVSIYSDSRGNSFSSYEQGNRILTKIRAEIDAGSFDISRYVPQKLRPLRFRNWSSAWLERRKIEAEKKLIAPSYLKELKRFVQMFQDYFKDEDIRDIGTKKVNDFYLTLKGSPKYIFNILSCFHKMLSDAFDWDEIKKIPKFPKIVVPEPDFEIINLDEQDAVIEKIKEPMDKAYILFTAREMVRPSETRALFWEDLDFKHNQVVIRRHFSLNELMPTTKSKNIKRLPLDGDVKEAFVRLPRHITSPFVFQKNGKPYSESYARKLWNRIRKEMGIKTTFYQGTKHSSASEATDRVGWDIVQEFLHHSYRATAKRYIKTNVNRLNPVLRKSGSGNRLET